MSNTIVPFSFELAQNFYESQDEFPVDFDDAWVWVEYSTKQMAEKALKGLIDGLDFLIDGLKSPSGGRPRKNIRLSYNGFKHFALMAGTNKGRNVRQTLIDSEKQARLNALLLSRQNQELQARIRDLESKQRLLPASDETRAQLMMKLADVADKTNDHRALVTAQAAMMNFVLPKDTPEATVQFLSVTEVLEANGYRIPKGKDGQLGKIVKQAWRQNHDGAEPNTCQKHIGTGHHTANIAIYPPEFWETIVLLAKNYLDM